MRIGIIGGGVVGQATARSLVEHVREVQVYDILKERRTHDLSSVLTSDLIFICLPTPQSEGSNRCDLTPLTSFIGQLANELDDYADLPLVLRSTVPVGTTNLLRKRTRCSRMIHYPEFLTARCSITDAHLPARHVIGHPNWHDVSSPFFPESPTGDTLKGLLTRRFPGVPIHEMSSDESEAVKLIQNSFFATCIAFWNECRTYADEEGLYWDLVLKAVLADGRIPHSHTRVPGPDGKYGFGGACLPKDIANLWNCMMNSGVGAPILSAVIDRNARDRKR